MWDQKENKQKKNVIDQTKMTFAYDIQSEEANRNNFDVSRFRTTVDARYYERNDHFISSPLFESQKHICQRKLKGYPFYNLHTLVHYTNHIC